jgi:hypothetical protein
MLPTEPSVGKRDERSANGNEDIMASSERTETDAAAAASASFVGPGQEGRESNRSQTSETSVGLSGRDLVEFRCVRNAAYHEDREMHYARMHRVLMFLVVVVGTASIGASLAQENKIATIGTAVAVLAGLVDLLWNIDGMARLHSSLRRRCFDLLARLEANESVDGVRAEFVRIIADEPPAMHAVNALAFNAAVDALGRPKSQKYELAFWKILLRHWRRFKPNEFPTVG